MTFIFNVFHRRLEETSDSRTSARLTRQRELAMCSRILLGLPSTFLISASSKMGNTSLDCEDFFKFVNQELKNLGQCGCALPYDITAHFFRGLLGASTQCGDPRGAVDAILCAAHSQCPIILTSAALWWPKLGPAIDCQWSGLLGGNLPKEIETLREIQSDVDRCLTRDTSLPLTHTTWLSAAVLHFTIRKKMGHESVLQVLGRNAVQMLDFLLFFSVLDLISVILKGGERLKKVLDRCLYIIDCLEERGGSWVTAFQPTKEKHMTVLHQAASAEFCNLLPLAFFSLAARLPLERAEVQQDFVCFALEMYDGFGKLFLDGNPLLDQMDTNEVFSNGHQFLLNCIRKCPPPSGVFRFHLPQMADSWEDKDPELAALLRNVLQRSYDEDLSEEPDLF